MNTNEDIAVTQRQPIATRLNHALELLCINTIRTLSMDAIQKATSGHPGAPMALAPLGFLLFDRHLKFNPLNPRWANRDRFILSNGHASMLLYSLLHLTGFDLPLEELKRFRQWESKTPGHPEHGVTPGVETTTGPLGQGVANSVGMAIAERWLEQHFNRGAYRIVDYGIYVICGDGDLMEGVSAEAASIAGHLGLSNLIWFYDNNRITIEGGTDLAFSEEVAERFKSYHWHVQHVNDANDLTGIQIAIEAARNESSRPSLIIIDSHIGWGSPHKQDTANAHGEPLGETEIRLTKQYYGWPEDAHFLVPDAVASYMAEAVDRGQRLEQEWNRMFSSYRGAYPELAVEWAQMQARELPTGWDKDIPAFPADLRGMASREASSKVLNSIAPNIPWLMGGAADLAPSTKTLIQGETSITKYSYLGRNLHFGVREHAMGSLLNGMALSGLHPYGATFLIFVDYMKPPVRLAALMKQPVILIYTHDSIGLGEDGPTHQPIEQLLGLRSIPGMTVLRPADANEVAEAWRVIMRIKDRPAALILTRQPVPTLDRSKYAEASGVAKGAYVMADSKEPRIILIGTGSEVHLCVEAYEALQNECIPARVVSMPSWDIFEAQSPEYRNKVLPPQITARIAVEAGTELGWERYVGSAGRTVTHSTFGASAPAKDLFHRFGFTVDNIVKQAKSLLAAGQ